MESLGTGLIIEFPSGVLYSNQTGGTSCLHPQIEGVFVPLRNEYQLPDGPILSAELDLVQYFAGPRHGGSGATRGIDTADADFIDSVLEQVRLRASVRVDRNRLRESHEAWIHVVISADESQDNSVAVFAEFTPYPRPGILTWSNSD